MSHNFMPDGAVVCATNLSLSMSYNIKNNTNIKKINESLS
jgi:hypothetical protein